MTPDEQRTEAIRIYLDENLTVRQVAARVGVRYATAGVWLRGQKPSRRKAIVAPAPPPSFEVVTTDSMRELFEQIVASVGIETALAWMSEITRARGRSLRNTATAMEIATEQIAIVLDRTRTTLRGA